MGLETAALVAVGGLGVAQYQQQGATGKFNQAVQNRNAQISEQESAQMQKQLEFDLARFDQQFGKIQGTTTTSVLKSGVALEGTGLRLLRTNAVEAQLQKILWNIILKLVKQRKWKKQTFIEYRDRLLDNKQSLHS